MNPDQKYYIRQIARDLKLQLNSVRRELDNLEKFGLLSSNLGKGESEPKEAKPLKGEEKLPGGQDKKFYKVNKDFILFNEIKGLIVKAQILYERDFLDKIKKTGQPRLVVFTGCFVNNTISPVDLLIVGQFQKAKLTKLIHDLERDLSKEVNYTILSKREFKYRRDMTDVFLFNILDGKRIVAVDDIGLS